jgi:hypothetical protein
MERDDHQSCSETEGVEELEPTMLGGFSDYLRFYQGVTIWAGYRVGVSVA